MADFDDIDRGWDDLLGDDPESPADGSVAAEGAERAKDEVKAEGDAAGSDEASGEERSASEPEADAVAVEVRGADAVAEPSEAKEDTGEVRAEAGEVDAEQAEAEERAAEPEERAAEAEERTAEAEAEAERTAEAEAEAEERAAEPEAEAEERAAEAEAEAASEAEDEGTAGDDAIAWRSPPAFEAADVDDEPRRRRVPAWTFAALGVPVVALIWYVGASSGEPEPTKSTAARVEAPAARSNEKAPPPAEPPKKAASGEPREVDPPAEAPDADPPPEKDAADPPPAIDGDASAYEAAQQRYRETKSPEALEAMGLAACRMDDGAKARSTYRKMRDRDARRNVFEACKATKIDLRWSGDGYTPVELVRRAARALDGGDAKQALELARESNNATRSDAAILLMGRAHCALGHPTQAERLRPHLTKASRQALHDACSKAGHDVGP